jgi:DNA-binding MarR family transcriptional regulator
MKRTLSGGTRHNRPASLLDLLNCLSRALRDDVRRRAVEHGLLRVHWEMLWYLRAANRYSNTLQVLAAYLGQTKGSISQSVQLLERRGLLRRVADIKDRRVTRLMLTKEGRSVLRRIETDKAWADAVQALPRAAVAQATDALTMLLRHRQQETGAATFGVCRSCACFQVEAADRFRCGVTGEPLDTFDSGQICHVHRLSGK